MGRIFVFLCLFPLLAVVSMAQLPFSVVGYRPAPGQFIDYGQYLDPGQDVESLDQDQVCRKLDSLMAQLPYSYLVSLGGFGGEITVRMDIPVRNVEGRDFKVYGNAFYNPAFTPRLTDRPGGSAEPGVIWVSRDENGNGQPDDTWYEIAGSAMYDSGTVRKYSVAYFLPDSISSDIPWKDNRGNKGCIRRSSFHVQPTYFPLWLSTDSLCFTGTRLPDNARWEENASGGGQWILFSFDWGYADNHSNMNDGSNIDLDWAVDSLGHPVHLESVDFIKVVCALNQQLGNGVGESSTEFAGIEPLGQDLSVEGSDMSGKDFCVGPNPCTHTLKVRFSPEALSGEKPFFLELWDVRGRCLGRVAPSLETLLDMQPYAPGLYILRYGDRYRKFLKR